MSSHFKLDPTSFSKFNHKLEKLYRNLLKDLNDNSKDDQYELLLKIDSTQVLLAVKTFNLLKKNTQQTI